MFHPTYAYVLFTRPEHALNPELSKQPGHAIPVRCQVVEVEPIDVRPCVDDMHDGILVHVPMLDEICLGRYRTQPVCDDWWIVAGHSSLSAPPPLRLRVHGTVRDLELLRSLRDIAEAFFKTHHQTAAC